jgi:acyl-CoA synthetase (AMP-forming)/AMP-acid ligase II
MSSSSSPVYPTLSGKSQPNLAQILDFNLEHNPNFPIFVYAENGSTKDIKMVEYVRAAHRLARAIRGNSQPGEVVAVVANIDALLYSALITGIIKAGLVVSRARYSFNCDSQFLFSHSQYPRVIRRLRCSILFVEPPFTGS